MQIVKEKAKGKKEIEMQRKARRHVCLWFRLKLAKQVAFICTPYRNGYASTICMLQEIGKEFRPYLTKAVILRYDVCRILGQSLESWMLSEVKQYEGLTEEQEAHYLAGQDEAMRLARQILA